MSFHWNQMTWSWLKLMPTKGRGKLRTGGRRNHMKWSDRLLKACLPTSWKTSRQDAHESSTKTDFFSFLQQRGLLCMVMQDKQAGWTTTTLEEQTLEESKTEEAPQSANCVPPAQHQADETPLGWVNRKLFAFLQTFSTASLPDQGWKVQCRGTRGVWKSTPVFRQQRYCWHQWGLKDMTGHDNFNPHLSLVWRLQVHNSGGVKQGCWPMHQFWVTILSWTLMLWELLASPMQGTPYWCYPVKWV